MNEVERKELEQVRAHVAWEDLMGNYEAPRDAKDEIFKHILTEYNSGRAYHNLGHVMNMLTVLEKVKPSAQNYNTLRLAVWFHDVIYDATNSDENEDKSARVAEKSLPLLNVPVDEVAEVARLVRMTKEHNAKEDDNDGLLLVDADFAILGSDSETYMKYAQGIRQEYKKYNDKEFAVGRINVLTGFLNRESIFHHQSIKGLLEERARENMKREIEILQEQARRYDETKNLYFDDPAKN